MLLFRGGANLDCLVMTYNADKTNGLVSVLAFQFREAVFICDRRSSLEDLLLL